MICLELFCDNDRFPINSNKLCWLPLQVTASGDQTVRLWDVNRDECLAVFKGHSCSVKSVDFREDDICKFSASFGNFGSITKKRTLVFIRFHGLDKYCRYVNIVTLFLPAWVHSKRIKDNLFNCSWPSFTEPIMCIFCERPLTETQSSTSLI